MDQQQLPPAPPPDQAWRAAEDSGQASDEDAGEEDAGEEDTGAATEDVTGVREVVRQDEKQLHIVQLRTDVNRSRVYEGDFHHPFHIPDIADDGKPVVSWSLHPSCRQHELLPLNTCRERERERGCWSDDE